MRWRSIAPGPIDSSPRADVCLIAEGCYPYVAGGVSTWIDWLIRSHPDLSFSALAILPGPPTGPPRYERPDNLRHVHHLYLDGVGNGRSGWPDVAPEEMSQLLGDILQEGDARAFERLVKMLSVKRPSLSALLDSHAAWRTLCDYYENMRHASFHGYFWAWRTLVGGLFRVLDAPVPDARVYHAVSTGYAGLFGAHASVATGRPLVITEHGIYSNERRIEILMADWIANSIDRGFDLNDNRTDIREFWATTFDSFARIAYAAASEITTLYGANQVFQRNLGAPEDRLRIIPNGVDTRRFAEVDRLSHARPTVGFIGRVTPIKDVLTFLDVASILRRRFPDLEALVIGPMDEDPEYAESCMTEAHFRGLDNTVTFTGPVDVRSYLGRIDVLVLTSISEALPLVVLEAGAAGVPCVTTDVGACREMLEGDLDGQGEPPGGIVVPVGASEEMAAALASLLTDRSLLEQYGLALKRRVEAHYRADAIAEAYQALYRRSLDLPAMEGA